jgi:sRNA-binding protein
MKKKIQEKRNVSVRKKKEKKKKQNKIKEERKRTRKKKKKKKPKKKKKTPKNKNKKKKKKKKKTLVQYYLGLLGLCLKMAEGCMFSILILWISLAIRVNGSGSCQLG